LIQTGSSRQREESGVERSHGEQAVQVPLRTWLQAGDWQRLREHFAQHPPRQAAEFAARALALLQSRGGPAVVGQAIQDLRQACALEPDKGLHAANLVQALLDNGQAAEALTAAQALWQRAPALYPAAEKRCLALQACGRWDEAAGALTDLLRLAAAQRMALSPQLRALQEDLGSRWWQPIGVGDATLRLPRPEDRSFVRESLADAAFMARYHRFEPTDAEAPDRYIERAQRPPRETRRREWIVQDRAGQPVGFAAIVDLDAGHRRGELLIGLRGGDRAAALALKAALGALAFAFDQLHLDKLVSHVYGDNPVAQHNTLHLGFRQEGRLREHLRIGGTRIDLIVNGLLAAEYAADARLSRLRERWLPAAPAQA
jgi:RimJ/RimL family protein N-acetyltransferase